MTIAAVAYTDDPESSAAGGALGAQIAAQFGGAPPDALLVFASSRYDCAALLWRLHTACQPKVAIGCTSAGEFTSRAHGEGSACAVALRSTDMSFAVGIGRGLRTDRTAAVTQLVSTFWGLADQTYPWRTAIVLTDALAGYTDALVEQLTLLTSGSYQFCGGGAGDDGRFERTHVFFGTEVISDAVVALEILSKKPLGVGVRHGWQPAGRGMRVTQSADTRLISLNAAPAVEAFEDHARVTGQLFEERAPLPFFLHNVLGVSVGDEYRLRVPLAVEADGAVSCAAGVPAGGLVTIMSTTTTSAADAAASATADAIRQLHGLQPCVGLFFDCVATRLRTGRGFGIELAGVQRILGAAALVGCNTYGQIARAEGQFHGFHNCTAVACVIPG